MSEDHWTYAKAGVDIDQSSEAVESLIKELRFRREGRGRPIEKRGQFTSLIDFDGVYLTLCTDGVGTKLLVAEELDKWDTIGIDCIAMNVNDTICCGAEPIAFVDYLAIDRPDPRIAEEIGKGLEKGARMSNMSIVGGEVAVMPEMVNGVDISGTCLGYVKKGEEVDATQISAGDRIIGLPSSGIHSNGLTLARRVLEENGIRYNEVLEGWDIPIGEELLVPTRIYVKEVLEMLRRVDVKGMVNITGGGLRNFLRLREDLGFNIDEPLPPPPVFAALQELGDIETGEMYQTFNMGMGFALVCDEGETSEALSALGEGSRVVGEVTDTKGVRLPDEDIEYTSY